ncbi:PREDICTED: phytol kinase 1, chloroplastic [Tarenaya hassleriana]|uniref:phytol kinase 1, chloroplastic n=1 Tax=Tarenaya hassleriana TaxID=28532 RepID=UPI00053C9349|nr:PREDICTED: phytol kinase 1, chloroplastic [Tarenaya hassleriana]
MAVSLPFSPISHWLSVPPSRRSYGYDEPPAKTRFSPASSLPPCVLGASFATVSAAGWRVRHHLIFTTAAGVAMDPVLQDVGATAAILGGAYSLVFAFKNLTKRDLIPQSLSRKLVHILSGLLFALSWPIFSASTEARYFAALVPLVNCLRLLVNGLSVSPDASLIQSVTREGKAEELLKGPLYYVIVLIITVLMFWRDSPIGMITLAMMCGGDGIADIMGRRFGSQKIPYNPRKSWVGSVSMFIVGFTISTGVLYYYSKLGYLNLNWDTALQRVALVSLVATIVESLPITDRLDDNLSVPMASIVAAYVSFGY